MRHALSLLPGLREVRTPLAAGYVLLAACIVALPTGSLARFQKSTNLSDVLSLINGLGTATILATLSFAAYLLGVTANTLVTATVSKTITRLNHRHEWIQLTAELCRPLLESRILELIARDDHFYHEYWSHCTDKTRERSDPVAPEWVISLREHEREVVLDLPNIPVRLLGKDPEYWSAWDRLKAEEDFRSTVAVCLLTLISALGVRVNPLFYLGTTLCALLLVQAVRKNREATEVILAGVLTGRIESPTVSRFDETHRIHWWHSNRRVKISRGTEDEDEDEDGYDNKGNGEMR